MRLAPVQFQTMGRAPNPGGPQRVSAHVVPKAKPFSEDDEKTSIESQWEDEASTTVEQGEVAHKIRELGIDPVPRNITNITNTSGSSLDEPTVDDQHANPVIAGINPPVVVSAHLTITQGNDMGQELEIHPGKSYTIGRGLDNDVVLTDIAVSRKHFDLRHEDGSWVIVDHGSGNGTVVNGNIEDNPFMLANGDTIEIGNTTFRFDHPDGAKRQPPGQELDDGVDDEELSTVAGKPLNQRVVDSEGPSSDVPTPPAAYSRPKTLPPPTPLRPHNPSQAPSYPLPGAMPASTLPMPQMGGRISAGPQSPTLLGEPLPNLNLSPTTLPGQIAPQQPMHPMYAGYPQATEIPPHSVHAQMLHIQQTQNKRGDMSSGMMPAPYAPAHAAPRFQPQPLTKRAKYILGGVALTVLAAITTVALIRSDKPGSHVAKSATPPTKTITPITADVPKIVKITTPPVAPIPPTPPIPDPKVAKPPEKIATTTDPKLVTPKITPPPAKVPEKIVKVEPKPLPKPDPKPEKIVKVEPKPLPPKPDPKPLPKPDPKPEKIVKVEPKPLPPKPDPEKQARTAPPKRTASADDARDRADALYREKKFNDAAQVLSAAAKSSSDPSEAKELGLKSRSYQGLGKAYNTGMAPGGKAGEQFDSLRAASTYDRQVGGAFQSDISAKLAQIAPRAAISFAGAKDFEKAHTAVIEAERLGATNDTIKLVRSKLEAAAQSLYQQAMQELSSNPSDAKQKFTQVKAIVDSKSATYQKADKQLSGG